MAWRNKFRWGRRGRCEAPISEDQEQQGPPPLSDSSETTERQSVSEVQEWDESEYDIIESPEESLEEERAVTDLPHRKEAEISTTAILGTNSSEIKQTLTGQRTGHHSHCNSLEDTLFEVNRACKLSLEYRYKKVFTPEAVNQLGEPLPLQDSACASNILSQEAKKKIQYVRRKICSNKIQQVISFTSSSKPANLDKLLPQMFGPSVPTMVLAYKSGSRDSLRDLHDTLSMTSAVSQSGKVLVVTDDLSTLKKKCFDNDELTEDAVKMLEELAVQRANHVADPANGGNCPSLRVQTSAVCSNGKPEFGRFRDDVNSHSCPLLVYDSELVLILHLKAYSIKNKRPVISLSYYQAAASHFALTRDQAEYILKKYQKAWLLYQPNEHLKDFIFLDLQWLNDAFNTALSIPQTSGDPFCSSWHHLQSEGKMDQALLDHIASRAPRVTGVDLPHNWLIKLLEHLQLLATFPPPSLSGHSYRAFIPLLLEENLAEEMNSFHPNADIASEYFLPFSGHAPPPLYMVRLITVLSKQKGFSLKSCKSASSAVFELTNYSNTLVRISEWKGFVRVQFCCAVVGTSLDNHEKREIAAVLNNIIPTADKVVCHALIPDHFLPCFSAPNAHMYLTCSWECCPYKEKHLAFCNYQSKVVECSKSGLKWPRSSLPPSQQFWFEEHQHLLRRRCVASSTRPASYISEGGFSDDGEDVHHVQEYMDRLDESLFSLLDLILIRPYLFQYRVLDSKQMEILLLKEKQENESWTLLSPSTPSATIPTFQAHECLDPHREAFSLIKEAVTNAGPRGVMALVAALKNSSPHENHRSQELLERLQEDPEYINVKRAWLMSVVAE